MDLSFYVTQALVRDCLVTRIGTRLLMLMGILLRSVLPSAFGPAAT